MMQRLREPARRSALVLATAAVVLASCLPVQASEPASLKWLPADVSFYSTMLHNRQQLDAIVKSTAWAKLMNVPFVKQYVGMAQNEYQNNPQALIVKAVLNQPENKELVALLGDLFSDEVFLAGGQNWGDFSELVAKVNSAYNYGPLKALATGKLDLGGQNPNMMQAKAVFEALADNSKLLKIPDILIGFKVPEPKKAETQLKRLEMFAKAVLALAPNLQEKFKHVKIGTGGFLALTLDGSMLPLDQIPFDDFDLDKDQVKKVVGALEKMTLSIHLGVSGDYVLLSLGSSTGLLPKLTGRGEKLADRDEMKVLAPYASKDLTAVNYVSKALRQRGAENSKEMDSLVEAAKGFLDKADLEEKQKKHVLEDVAELVAMGKQNIPVFGALLGFSFTTESGSEGYQVDFGPHPDRTKPKPLTLLHHLGGSPLLAGVFRNDVDPEAYQKSVKIVKQLYRHGDEIARSKLEGDAKDKYIKFTDAALPLLKRFDEITRTLYLPAIAEGQTGFVIDAKWKSKQWHRMLETPMALPVPEIGIVVGVSDKDKLVQAVTAYARLVEDAVAAAREVAPDGNIPDFKIPPPRTETKETGTIYYYALPELLGVDERVAPTAGVNKHVAVLTLSHQHAFRLLANHPLQVKDAAFANPKHPLLSATIFNWTGLVDLLVPWAEFAAGKLVPQDDEAQHKALLREINTQIKTIAEVLKVFKGTTTATYVEDGKLVTHSVSIVQDLEK